MALIDLVFAIFILYLLYKLVFSLILPVSKAASSIRDQVRNVQTNGTMQEPRDASFSSAPGSGKETATTSKEGDYIDFEEVK